jgi:capsular polysaccharide biosynthesis protein
MDLQEVTRRVVLGHWVVIVACVVVCAGAVTAYHLTDTEMYSASTRVVLDVPAPTSGTEALAVADMAKGIVTSPTHIVAALKVAEAFRDPVKEISNITVAPLGTSGILQITVKDSNPVAAAAIANALANDLIQTRIDVGPAAKRAKLDAQIKTLSDRIAVIDQDIAALNGQLRDLQVDRSNTPATATQAQILAYRITALSSQRTALTDESLHLDSQRANLGSAYLTTPSVVDVATVATKADPSRLPIDLALAVIIGLVLGVGAAGAMETFRPMLSSGDAVARTLSVPVLGWLPDPTGTLAARLKLAAGSGDVRALELIGIGDSPDLSAVARSLRGQLSQGEGEGKGIAIFSMKDAPPRYRNAQAPAHGFVLVTPDRIKKESLIQVQELMALSGRPLLGLIVHRPARAVKTLEAENPIPRFAVLEREKEPDNGMSREMQSDLWGAQ